MRILTECNKVVLFPNSGSFYQYLQYLRQYLGIPTKEAKKILRVDSRWLTIFTECPLYFMTEKKIYMNIMNDDWVWYTNNYLFIFLFIFFNNII